MNLDQYQNAAKRTLNVDWPFDQQVSNAALGLAGEAGEVADILKKALYHGHKLDKAELSKELGDVLWYLAALASLHGLYLDDIAEQNIAKLRARYPNGFTQADSQARADCT
jgi:NTP pyrophosphatase (non-canonical NTP hydrolase)